MLMHTDLIGFGAKPIGPIDLSYLGSSVDVVDRSTYTFSSQGLGTAAWDRIIIVGFIAQAAGNVTVNSITVGGVAAPLIAVQNNPSLIPVVFGAVSIPTGTTANVVIALTGTAARGMITMWSLTGTDLVTTPDDIASHAVVGTTSVDTLDIPGGGMACGIAYGTGSSLTGCNWTGLTENMDNIVGAEENRRSAATSGLFTQNDVARTIQAVFPGAGTSRLLALAFGPK